MTAEKAHPVNARPLTYLLKMLVTLRDSAGQYEKSGHDSSALQLSPLDREQQVISCCGVFKLHLLFFEITI